MDSDRLLARAVEDSVFRALMLAYGCHLGGDEKMADRWRAHADRLDSKFKTQTGRHYSEFLGIRNSFG